MQVRRNASEYQNSVKDLYSWEKEIKSKEEALKHAPAPKIQPSNVSSTCRKGWTLVTLLFLHAL